MSYTWVTDAIDQVSTHSQGTGEQKIENRENNFNSEEDKKK
jgi:hypothetical protein